MLLLAAAVHSEPWQSVDCTLNDAAQHQTSTDAPPPRRPEPNPTRPLEPNPSLGVGHRRYHHDGESSRRPRVGKGRTSPRPKSLWLQPDPPPIADPYLTKFLNIPGGHYCDGNVPWTPAKTAEYPRPKYGLENIRENAGVVDKRCVILVDDRGRISPLLTGGLASCVSDERGVRWRTPSRCGAVAGGRRPSLGLTKSSGSSRGEARPHTTHAIAAPLRARTAVSLIFTHRARRFRAFVPPHHEDAASRRKAAASGDPTYL